MISSLAPWSRKCLRLLLFAVVFNFGEAIARVSEYELLPALLSQVYSIAHLINSSILTSQYILIEAFIHNNLFKLISRSKS